MPIVSAHFRSLCVSQRSQYEVMVDAVDPSVVGGTPAAAAQQALERRAEVAVEQRVD